MDVWDGDSPGVDVPCLGAVLVVTDPVDFAAGPDVLVLIRVYEQALGKEVRR